MDVVVPYATSRKPTEEFIEFDGANFKTSFWDIPEGTEYKGRIVYVHGFAEHAELYTVFFDKLSQEGYRVFFFEQRGSGETSPGKEVGVTNEYHVFHDLDFMIKLNYEKLDLDDEKLILMGHLMGGGIILNYGIKGEHRDKIKCCVTSGPLVLLHPKTIPNIVTRTLGPYIAMILPNLKIDTKLQYDYLTHDEKWIEYIKNHDKKLIGGLRQLSDMILRGEKLTKESYVANFDPDIKVLILHGTDDFINSIEGSAKFISLSPKDVLKEFYRIAGGKHSLFIESEDILEDVFAKVVSFLEKA